MKLHALILFLVAIGASGATWYVDYETGSDSNAGTSTNAPFKHCPGDAEATSTALATHFSSGDSVFFKGGSRYTGRIIIDRSGSPGIPITYEGTGWGTGSAIIDGTVMLGQTWTNCTSAGEVAGNTNYVNIWRTVAPTNVTPFTSLILSNAFLPFSHSPNMEDPVTFDNDMTLWHTVSSSKITSTSIVDSVVFTNASAAYWTNSWIAVWRQPNLVTFTRITNSVPASNRIEFASVGSVYPDRDSYYLLINHEALIDQPGEYAYGTNGCLYLWAPNSGNPNGQPIRISRYYTGFTGDSAHDVTVRNFTVQGYFADMLGYWRGNGINFNGSSGGNSSNITITGNTIQLCRSMENSPSLVISRATNCVIANNYLTENFECRGIYSTGSNVVASSNVVRKIGGAGIYFAGVANGLIYSNTISEIKGVHANAITVYQNSTDCVVSNNWVHDVLFMFSFQEYTNLTIVNNLFDASAIDSKVNEWGNSGNGYLRFLNNSVVNHPYHTGLQVGTSAGNPVTYMLTNNIIDGGGPRDDLGLTINRNYNMYVGLSAFNAGANGWSLNSGDVLNTNTAAVFAGVGDYQPKVGGPAERSGFALSEVSTDITGSTRTAPYSIGAFEQDGSTASISIGTATVGTLISQ